MRGKDRTINTEIYPEQIKHLFTVIYSVYSNFDKGLNCVLTTGVFRIQSNLSLSFIQQEGQVQLITQN